MKNKLTVLGLVAATAFIFTSCTKDTDVTPGSKFAAPTATLEAPALNDGAITKNGNEYEEADNGQSIPGMETATPNEPTQTPPTFNNTNRIGYSTTIRNIQTPSQEPVPAGVQANTTRYQEYWTGVRDVHAPSHDPAPVNEQANATRYQEEFYMGVKNDPTPNQIPPVMDAPSTDRYESTTKDLYPVSPIPTMPNILPYDYMTPKGVSPNAVRLYNISIQNPTDPLPSEPHVIPSSFDNPTGVSSNTGRTSGNGGLPDCTFPVVSSNNGASNDK